MSIMQLYFHRILAETETELCLLCVDRPHLEWCWLPKSEIYAVELFKHSVHRPGLVFIEHTLFDAKVHEMTGDWL